MRISERCVGWRESEIDGGSEIPHYSKADSGDVILMTPGLDPGKFDAPANLGRLAAAYSDVNADSADLSAFKHRGGKLIMYQGWLDEAIPPRNSIAYFNRVSSATAAADSFYRLFMIPGMLHCAGGPGCGSVDWLSAITGWVEGGLAPDMLVATKYEGDDPGGRVERTGLICPYPLKAVWNRRGDKRRAQSFHCGRAAAR